LAFSLLFWTFFVPARAVEADFFSSLTSLFTGDQVYAETNSSAEKSLSNDNSQTITLLQANVSSISILNDKDSLVNVNPNDNIVSGTSLLPATGPMGVSDGKDVPNPSKEDTSVYVVRKGDTLSQIASMFNISIDTILWANDMKKGEKLAEGEVLLILPISGLEHTVAKGQTLQSIAKLYKVDVNDIIQNNDIAEETKLAIGDTLIIPNASKSEEKPIKITSDTKYFENYPAENLIGFINPVPGYRLSQGLHDGNAVDLAIAKGTPIHVVASGRVIFAKMGYNGGFGGLVIVVHPNGIQTLYAHQSKITVHSGDQVHQGEVIGYVGSTGHSTGPHVHFAVKGAFNPGLNGSWAN